MYKYNLFTAWYVSDMTIWHQYCQRSWMSAQMMLWMYSKTTVNFRRKKSLHQTLTQSRPRRRSQQRLLSQKFKRSCLGWVTVVLSAETAAKYVTHKITSLHNYVEMADNCVCQTSENKKKQLFLWTVQIYSAFDGRSETCFCFPYILTASYILLHLAGHASACVSWCRSCETMVKVSLHAEEDWIYCNQIIYKIKNILEK